MKKSYLLIFSVIVLIIVAISLGRNKVSISSGNDDLFRNIHRLILTKHAKCRMDCRHITEEEIKDVIHEGNVNYSRSGRGNKGDDTYALEGYSNEHQHLRIVVAPENDGLVVITCIDLDHEWPCNCN